ncbi:MAG: glycosyltransferase family 4 protein [Phyllobacterium sp.]|uniref:glycosyltransferase family 4 protein n=1 Tax=Phyllobacterium sp. TaxID=1871046 RepID=UPI0030F0FBA5
MSGSVVVSQLGARMHYAVPRIFASEGRLAHFYTDICATEGWPRLVNRLPRRLLPSSMKRLSGRIPKGVPAELTSTFPNFGARSAIRRLREKNSIDHMAHTVWAGSEFSRLVASSGFHDADGLYAFSGDALEQMQAAKQQGMWTAVEQMIAPWNVVEELVRGEHASFPDWAGPYIENQYAQTFAEREKAEWALADVIVCPSEFVRRNVIERGGSPERCVVVPYGIDPQFPAQDIIRIGGPLRVLTVGEVGLRKGSPYVAGAARLLGKSATFRMAGPSKLSTEVKARLSQSVELRGIIPRAEMAKEYEWADVFLLPSICEGSATAIYEALAAGLPVICTENAGSVVRDGVEGFIVPIRDSQAIAKAITELSDHPGTRAAMSENAVSRAAEFTVKRYGERLLDALSMLPSPRQNQAARS